MQNAKLGPLPPKHTCNPCPALLLHSPIHPPTLQKLSGQGTEEPHEETTTYGEIIHTGRGLQDPGWHPRHINQRGDHHAPPDRQ